MDKFWHYLNQGLKLQVIFFLSHISLLLVTLPFVLAFNLDDTGISVVAIVLYIIIAIPISSYLSLNSWLRLKAYKY